jgi:membrane associated rhomboid family serine protease
MGIYDRGYYEDDEWKGPAGQRRSGPRTIVATLIIINVAVFLLDMFSGKVLLSNGQQFDSLKLSYVLALKHGASDLGGKGPFDNPLYAYQLITYGFAHASITSERGIYHILFNMFALFMLGRPVEQHYGSREFLRIYLAAIVFSGLVWLLSYLATGQTGIAVGASGAVVAVVMLFVFNFPRQTVLLMGIIPMPAWVLGVMLVGFDLMNSLNPKSGIAFQAHLGGAAFAALYFYRKWHFNWLGFDWLRFDWLTNRVKGRPRLKVHKPGKSPDGISSEADQVLEKVHRQGEASLTRRERKILEKYSRQVREKRGD